MEKIQYGDSLNIDKTRKEEPEMTPRVLYLGHQKTKVKKWTLLFEFQERKEGRSMF